MPVELKPCPFCGGEAKIERRKPGGTGSSGMEPYMQRAACACCGIATGWKHPRDEWGKQKKHDDALESELAEKWNGRAAERASQGAAAGVPEDFITHRDAWRDGLNRAVRYAKDSDDASYWMHEVRAFDRAYAQLLAAAPSAPTQGAEREVRDEDGNAIDSRNAGEDYA